MTTEPLILQRGDVFVCEGNMGVVSAAIRGAQKILSRDNRADYGHAGIVTSATGTTLEALWTVRSGHLDHYAGQRILIARPARSLYRPQVDITLRTRDLAIDQIERQYLGRVYPLWRLPLHLVPWAAKYASTGRWLVCSELVAKYLVLIAARDTVYAGISPDTLADEWVCFRNFDVLYEGDWRPSLLGARRQP